MVLEKYDIHKIKRLSEVSVGGGGGGQAVRRKGLHTHSSLEVA